MTGNRTIQNSGVRLSGDLLNIAAVTGTGITPAAAAAMAGVIQELIDLFPYQLDAQGKLDYRAPTTTLTHPPELVYGPEHPLAGQPVNADYFGGQFVTRYGGAPMPYIDWDLIPPVVLEKLLGALQQIRDVQLNAT